MAFGFPAGAGDRRPPPDRLFPSPHLATKESRPAGTNTPGKPIAFKHSQLLADFNEALLLQRPSKPFLVTNPQKSRQKSAKPLSPGTKYSSVYSSKNLPRLHCVSNDLRYNMFIAKEGWGGRFGVIPSRPYTYIFDYIYIQL